MKKSTKITTVQELVEECEYLMKLTFEDDYITSYIKDNDDEIVGFIAKDFTLHYWGDPGLFYISFIVGTKCKLASDVTKLLSTVINFEYLYTLDDFYWDYDNNKMLFGDEAVHKKYQDYLEKKNRAECPICNGVHSKKNLSKDGFCMVCENIKGELTWH